MDDIRTPSPAPTFHTLEDSTAGERKINVFLHLRDVEQRCTGSHVAAGKKREGGGFLVPPSAGCKGGRVHCIRSLQLNDTSCYRRPSDVTFRGLSRIYHTKSSIMWSFHPFLDWEHVAMPSEMAPLDYKKIPSSAGPHTTKA